MCIRDRFKLDSIAAAAVPTKKVNVNARVASHGAPANRAIAAPAAKKISNGAAAGGDDWEEF